MCSCLIIIYSYRLLFDRYKLISENQFVHCIVEAAHLGRRVWKFSLSLLLIWSFHTFHTFNAFNNFNTFYTYFMFLQNSLSEPLSS